MHHRKQLGRLILHQCSYTGDIPIMLFIHHHSVPNMNGLDSPRFRRPLRSFGRTGLLTCLASESDTKTSQRHICAVCGSTEQVTSRQSGQPAYPEPSQMDRDFSDRPARHTTNPGAHLHNSTYAAIISKVHYQSHHPSELVQAVQ